MQSFNIALIPGDGVGMETVPEAVRVLDRVASLFNQVRFRYQMFDWSCQRYLDTGSMMPADGLARLGDFDAIIMGAVGYPTVPDHISLWGLLLPIRRTFDQYVNLRPVKLLPGVRSPLRDYQTGDIDFMVVRENTEGEYSNMGGRLRAGTSEEVVVQNAVFTRYGTERVMRYAFELARHSRQHLTSATKSNGINYSMPFWDDVFHEIGQEYPGIRQDSNHIDALTAYFITRPDSFDVVVASNLFGDILTDLGAAIQGSVGIAPSANINPEKKYPSMFEPIHGSAPDIAGRGIANPIGQIWAAKMMLDHLGLAPLGNRVLQAVEATLTEGIKTPDLGGTATTQMVTDSIIRGLDVLPYD